MLDVFEGYLYNCTQKRKALKNALSAFGEDAYRLIVSQLEDKYKLIIEGEPCSAIEDIEIALRDIAGSSADLIIARMHQFLRETRVQNR